MRTKTSNRIGERRRGRRKEEKERSMKRRDVGDAEMRRICSVEEELVLNDSRR